ncbi:MAG: twin-arginine translocase TatA/TatE family subunit [Actinobacteria bacterium]|nr:twin-arginine translocase TatA/TatE family subunit [Actinomycetota bacterium]
MNIGPLEIGILIVVVLLLFGSRKLPEIGSSLGQSIRGFGKGISGDSDEPAAVESSTPASEPAPKQSPPNE